MGWGGVRVSERERGNGGRERGEGERLGGKEGWER